MTPDEERARRREWTAERDRLLALHRAAPRLLEYLSRYVALVDNTGLLIACDGAEALQAEARAFLAELTGGAA